MGAPDLAHDRNEGTPVPTSGEPIQILLVDDDEVDRRAVRRALASWPALHLTEVEDARSALDALERHPFDCALIDYRLPGKNDGLDVLRAARRLGVRTPVVVLTGHGDEQTAVEMMKAGASDYIPKSAFSAERVNQSVRSAIRLRRAEDSAERAQLALGSSILREQAARAEAELQRERLRSAFLQAPALINVHRGPEHVFELVHPLTRKLFGDRVFEGRPLRTALPELAGAGVFEAFDRVYASGQPYFGREVRLELACPVPGEAAHAYFDFVYQPVKDTAARIEGVMVVAMEVTDMVTARQRAEILLGDLQNAVRTREDLLAVVSHDLRNPLGAIMGSASSLLRRERPVAPTEVQTHAGRIARAADAMTRLIDGLLDLAKIDSGTLSLVLEPQDLRALVEETVEMMRPAADRKRLLLENATPSGLSLRCDKARLQQVLSNLLGNAIKFTPEGGTVAIRAEETPDEVHFRITDSGPGIAKQNLPHIFDRYWQAGAQQQKPGIGLGLSIVRGLVEAHQGRVWAESELGVGTTVHFVLPRAQAPVQVRRNAPEGDLRTVLVVDDDADTRNSVAEILEAHGYRVHVASNGQEALDTLRGEGPRPGLILLDMMMPVMDGSTFRSEQQRDPALSAIPVVVFSAYGSVARTAANLRAAGYLAKPLTMDSLLQTIARVSQKEARPS
jgi:signal transduction histidine kinase/DNA-binding response OmpR family regulator